MKDSHYADAGQDIGRWIGIGCAKKWTRALGVIVTGIGSSIGKVLDFASTEEMQRNMQEFDDR